MRRVAGERALLRLDRGVPLLERWSAAVGQTERNAAYKALFAIADGSVFRAYTIVDDAARPREFSVVVRDGLIIKVCLRHPDAFGIVYIGSLDDAPDDAPAPFLG